MPPTLKRGANNHCAYGAGAGLLLIRRGSGLGWKSGAGLARGSWYPKGMKFGVLVFPGSNCDHDTYNVIAEVARQPVTFLWHDSEDLQGVDAVLVPGGFAYGDYLRTGAIARFSPVMQ